MSEQEGKYTLNPKFKGIYGKRIASPLGRIAFLHLTKPNTKFVPNKYGLALLVSKEDPKELAQLKAIQEMCKEMAIQLWGENVNENIKKITYPMFRNGDEQPDLVGYPGSWVLNLKNAEGPGKARGFKVLNQDMEVDDFEAGMICRCEIEPYLGPDGFSYKFTSIKKVKDDGVRFAGGPPQGDTIKDLDKDVEDAAQAVTTSNVGLGVL